MVIQAQSALLPLSRVKEKAASFSHAFSVGELVGAAVGELVGEEVGELVGFEEGFPVGALEGEAETMKGAAVGVAEGLILLVGLLVG